MSKIDWNSGSLSNVNSIVTMHFDLDVEIDFEQRILYGSIALLLEAISDTASVVLDSSALQIERVLINDQETEFALAESNVLGEALHIACRLKKGDRLVCKIYYSSTDKSQGLQWLSKEQTLDKTSPFLFTQCQAIFARSLMPCQDNTAIKSTFSAKIRSPYQVLCSARPTRTTDYADGKSTFHFEQPMPVPTQLFAIASGDMASTRIGPRSMVYTEPSKLLACQQEFEAHMELFIETAEKIIYPYPWGSYNIFVAPPSYPYGGTENPNMTFVTKSVVVGDKSEISLVAHELAHSWSGNHCTNANWGHFWLNEGWTTYLERKILGNAFQDQDVRLFNHDIGWRRLQDDLDFFGRNNSYTQIVYDIQPNQTPEDVYSLAQYEKGSYFLFYLENFIGPEEFDKFIPHYFTTFSPGIVKTSEFLDCLRKYFQDTTVNQKLENFDFNAWLYTSGDPPVLPDFSNSLSNQVYKFVEEWKSTKSANEFSKKDIKGWLSTQVQLFLEILSQSETKIGKDRVLQIDSIYDFSKSNNDNILRSIYLLSIKNNVRLFFPDIAKWLGQTGRVLNIKSIYRALYACDKDFAIQTFRSHENFYHPISISILKKLLKI